MQNLCKPLKISEVLWNTLKIFESLWKWHAFFLDHGADKRFFLDPGADGSGQTPKAGLLRSTISGLLPCCTNFMFFLVFFLKIYKNCATWNPELVRFSKTYFGGVWPDPSAPGSRKNKTSLSAPGSRKNRDLFFFHAIFFSPNSQIQTLKSKVPDPKCKI